MKFKQKLVEPLLKEKNEHHEQNDANHPTLLHEENEKKRIKSKNLNINPDGNKMAEEDVVERRKLAETANKNKAYRHMKFDIFLIFYFTKIYTYSRNFIFSCNTQKN